MKISQPLPFNFHFFLFINRKRSAYGIRSNRKTNTGRVGEYHNLLFDFDANLPSNTSFDWTERTPHGFHAVILGQYSFNRAIREISSYKTIDRTWLSMGIKRGYWFLELYHLPPRRILHHLKTMRIKRF